MIMYQANKMQNQPIVINWLWQHKKLKNKKQTTNFMNRIKLTQNFLGKES